MENSFDAAGRKMPNVFSDSDWESYTFSSDSEDQDDLEFMYGGHAQSILSSLAESIGKIDSFLAFERGYTHGDIVCGISDPSGQTGRVVDVDIVIDLETLSGDIIKNVNTKELLKLHSFGVGDNVIHGPWLGKVTRVVDLITVLFDDGAKCEITADLENILPICPNVLEDSQYLYYPGQCVQIRVPTLLKSAKWLCGTWKANRKEGTVCHVEVASVFVNWITSVMVGCSITLPAPAHQQEPKNLFLLSCFPYTNWQLGDWCKLSSTSYENHLGGFKSKSFPNSATQIVPKWYKKYGGPRSVDPNYGNIFVIVRAQSKVDVMWQDGNLKLDLDSESLVLVDNIGDHDFWPFQFVLLKGAYDNTNVSMGQRLGIVKSVDANERTVKVNWMSQDLKCTVEEETVSAYELIDHPEYNYALGDIVFRFLPDAKDLEGYLPFLKNIGQDDNLKETNVMKMAASSLQQLEKDVLTKMCVSEDHCMENGFLSCIGNVTGYKDGAIEVRWASGLVSKVGPYDIVGTDRYDDLSSTPIPEQDIDMNGCQEIPEGDKQPPEEKDKDDLEKTVVHTDKDSKQDWWDARAMLIPRAAFGFLASFANSLFCSQGSTSLLGPTQSHFPDNSKSFCTDVESSKDVADVFYPSWEKSSDFKSLHGKVILDAKDLKGLDQTMLRQEMQEIHHKNEISLFARNEKLGKFKQFDIANDYSDHQFHNCIGKGSILSQVKQSWFKKVQQEWNLLESNLPDTFYFRVYEERIDLMRVAMVGATGTPYHDGLFFFDIFLPPDYPLQPPLVHYNSGGLRLNPNLYESGKICLSLLNTWTGTGTEVWNPESSSILQVLLSLHALVLNEKPYFNEAGYDKMIGRPDGEKNSITYNESAFLLSCKSMLYLLCKPPKNFEELVEEHFRCHSRTILLACKAYMDGAQVGFAFGGKVLGEPHKSCSMGFKIMLSKIFPKLVSAFAEKGIDCHEFLEQESDLPKPG